VRRSVLGLRCFVAYAQRLASWPWVVGACTRIRTRDQLIKSQLLYQLSYAGAPAILASLDLGLRRSTTSSNHPLAFVNQLDVRVSVRAPARWNSRGSP
jgi:hypothetical protein